MNRKQAIEYSLIIKAFVEGKEIQVKRKDDTWEKVKEIYTDRDLIYRIKPEDKYRPFNSAEECWQEMQKHTPFGWVQDKDNSSFKQYILSVDKEGVMISDYDDGTMFLTYESLFGFCTFVDGTPLGVKN